jgi:hypothetical protein
MLRNLRAVPIGLAFMLASPSPCAAEEKPAPEAPKPPPGCTAPEHRQFDFWVGHWRVTEHGKLAGDNHAKETGLLALEALGHAQVFVFAMKQVSNRQRPYQNDGTGSFWKGGNSFPSGHAASSFAVATIFAREYRDHIAVPIVAYSLATAISISRIGAQRHWMSDIFVGGSMGFLIGRYTYRQNHDRSLPGAKVSGIGKLMPQVGLGPAGPALSWAF